jgi:CHASE1-domain containing sensor protein
MLDLPDINRRWQPIGHLWPVIVAACFGLVVAITAWFAVSIWEERVARVKFNSAAQDYAEALQNGLNEYLSKIRADARLL